MSDEELRKIMEFIIKRQESFSEKVDQFSEELKEMRRLHEERLGQLERAAVNLYDTVEGLAQSQRVLTVKMVELAEAQAHTDQRLNVLIDIIAQGRGGQPDVN
ncbi:MAG: hypothetical protein JOZ02_22995 [Acidobacteria bacterium]|nr:hypothetical protein [Acidobacteriota bacterium]